MNKNEDIETRIAECCNTMLNEDYLELSFKIMEDYQGVHPGGMKRGSIDIWAASIVWAAGSVNFLYDKASEPYATLNDICTFFGVRNATVGSKAGQIRKILGMDKFNENYLLEGSPLTQIMDSMLMTAEGFVFFDPAVGLEQEQVEDDGEIKHHSISGRAHKATSYVQRLQYEYLFEAEVKKWIASDGRERGIIFSWEDNQGLTINVDCTLTEARELEDLMWSKGLR